MNGYDMKDYKEVGFVKVEKRSCSVNYRVNMVICGDEHCGYVNEAGFQIVDHGMTDHKIYDLLGDVKEVTLSSNSMVEVKISENVSARIYTNK